MAATTSLPPYDLEAMLIEVELLLDWYLPHVVGQGGVRLRPGRVPEPLERGAGRLADGPRTWVMRDYHSPNLIWLPERERRAARRADRLPGRGARPAGLRRRLAPAGRAPDGSRSSWSCGSSASTPARERGEPDFDRAAFARVLRADGRAARDQDARHLRPARPAGRQARPISSTFPRVEAYLVRDLAHPVLDAAEGLV